MSLIRDYINNSRELSVDTVATDTEMSDLTEEVVTSQPNIYGAGTSKVSAIVSCSQAEYDALIPVLDVIYLITS